jgi:hypothetical protein
LIETALEPVKLLESIRQAGCDVGSRLAVQPLRLDEPGTSGRIPEGASKVASGLGVVVGARQASPPSDVTLMRISCDGRWTMKKA